MVTPKIVKKQTTQEAQSPEDLAKLQDYAKNLMQQAKEYNDTYLDIPEIYKTFEPSPSMILVRLKLSPHPNYEVIGFEKETNAAKGQLMNYWANEEHRKGYGVVVAGSLPFGTNVIVSPAAFYQQNFLISEENSFTSPIHKLPGFFLINKNLILGTYKDETTI
jgi:hypothetical protein